MTGIIIPDEKMTNDDGKITSNPIQSIISCADRSYFGVGMFVFFVSLLFNEVKDKCQRLKMIFVNPFFKILYSHFLAHLEIRHF